MLGHSFEAAHPTLRSGTQVKKSTLPPCKLRTWGRAQISDPTLWATAPACLAALKTTIILIISRRVSSDSATLSRQFASFF